MRMGNDIRLSESEEKSLIRIFQKLNDLKISSEDTNELTQIKF